MSQEYHSQWNSIQSPPQYYSQNPYPSQSQQKPAFGRKYTEVAIDEHAVPPYRKQTFKQKYLGGQKRTLRAFAAVGVIVLIVNLSWLAYAKSHYGIVNGFGTIRQGACSEVKSLSTWYHLLINILSTLLLTGSNAFMTVYSCPSRQEVDKAHQRGRVLNVGGLSLWNLRGIAKRKGLVVLVLAISSVPFHLLYNSLVFTSLSTNQYYMSIVTESFLTGAPFNLTGPWNDNVPYFSASPPSSSFGDTWDLDIAGQLALEQTMDQYWTDMQQNASSWERLENKDCIQKYANVFLSDRRNVLLVSSTKNDTNSVLLYEDADIVADMSSNWWICSKDFNDGGNQACNPGDFSSVASNWTVFDYPIEYCLSQPTVDTCSVNFSVLIMTLVVSFNALKVVLMLWVLLRFDAEHILTSVGDACASFLTNEDPTTMQMCFADKRDIKRHWQQRGFARPFNSRSRHWGSSVSKKRWAFFFFFMMLSFFIVFIFGIWGFSHVKDQGVHLTATGLWQLGFGSLNQNALAIYGAEAGDNPVLMALIANIPQIFLALVYLAYMSIMTSMFVAQDWSHFAFKGQTLMVSTPSGKQRGTWLFGAPLAWGITLLALQTLLHWFVSQSLFMIQITVYDKDGKPLVPNKEANWNDFSKFSNCGYSPIAIIFSMVAALILLFSAVIFMFRRFGPGAPPVVGTSSAAISAACHPMMRDEDMVFKELRWGVSGGFPNGVGHCSLVIEEAWSSGRAHAPVPGYTYA